MKAKSQRTMRIAQRHLLRKKQEAGKDLKKTQKTERFRYGELKDIVVSALSLTILVGGTVVVSPNFPIFYGLILSLIDKANGKRFTLNNKSKIKKVMKVLEMKNIIFLEEKGDKVFVHVKNMINSPVLTYSIRTLLDYKRKEKKWNGKWFMVFFDVPESQRNKRNYLRKYLKRLGFYCYQQSVYIFPYECENEVALIKRIVEGGKYMKYIIAEKIEDENQIKRYFGLTK